MSRIELRGVIVPSIYDQDFMEEYIAKGILMPESRFRKMLAEASKTEPLSVYINSPGGSVFAAFEMVNAAVEWKIANSQPLQIVVGAMAASAAFVTASRADVMIDS
jgi:ClpP class serine protease